MTDLDGRGLPEALTRPDFVLANLLASPSRGLGLVDWQAPAAARDFGRWPGCSSLRVRGICAGSTALSDPGVGTGDHITYR
jgi:hypothetical protein